MNTTYILRGYSTTNLRQLAVYLKEFQGYTFITPENERHKKCWMNSLNQMFSQKDLVEPLSEYLARLEINIRWFRHHKIIFRRGMGTGAAFYGKMTRNFARNVTDTTIEFKNQNRESVEMLRSDITFCEDINREFERNPNTMNIRNFYYDERYGRPSRERRVIFDSLDLDIILAEDDYYIQSSVVSAPKQQPQDEEATEETKGLECKVCRVNKICIVLAKCGHTFCHTCTTRIDNKCATCRTPFTKANMIRMYI